MHMVSKRDLRSADMSQTTVMMANGEVQTRKEATVHVKELDLFVTVMLLEETPAVLSLGKLCEGSWVDLPLDQQSKTTSHPKGQEKRLQYVKLCAIRSPLVYLRVPLQRPHLLLHHHLHHGIPYLTRADTPKILVPERTGSTSDELQGNINPQKPKTNIK